MKRLLSATLTNDTPVFLGGYDTKYARDGSSEGLRTQSLKGLLRYWMRVYLAGAGYELNRIDEEVNKICGGKIQNDLHASVIKLGCKIEEDEPVHSLTPELREVPRIRLLTLARQDLTFARKIKARISLQYMKSIAENSKILIIGSLVTGLLLSGIGKMGRRGFGCFSIQIEEDETRLFRIVNALFSPNPTDKRIELIKEIISITKKSITDSAYTLNGIPEIHAMHPDYCKMFYIPLKTKDTLTALRELQGFTVRPIRSRVLPMDEITREHLAWFMGLPRSQRGTGYFTNAERRASPIFISVHKEFALVSFFRSRDWPSDIQWKGRGNKSLKADIERAFDTVTESFMQYMKNKRYEVKEVELTN
ncbi:MAG: hypothetical protein NZ908_02970 [Candidatus Micrarchaeota archaeon]|nr:hypothetical protein [Candidatus Micrarchaeota archaeon]